MKREELFDKYLRGELTGRETAELKQLLADDAAAGRAFVEHVNETNLIIRVGSQLQPAEAQKVVSLEPEPSMNRRRFWRRVTAAAACVIGLAVLAIALSRSSEPWHGDGFVSGTGVQVTRDGALLHGDRIDLRPGDLVATASNSVAVIAYEHESTRLQIFPGTVVLCADADGGKRFELKRGGLQARVAPQPAGRPLLVTTPHAEATVVGTEFVVRADERITKLDVFNGRVELAGRSVAKTISVKGGYWASATGSAVADPKPLCKCSKCRGTNEPSNCPNLKKQK